MKSNILKNISWLFGDHVITFLGGFFISVWLARYLGSSQLGVYSYAMAIFSIGSNVSSLGLTGIAVKEIVSSKNVNKSISTIFVLKMLGAVLSFFALFAYILLSNGGEQRTWLTMILLAGLFLNPFSVLDNYFDGKVKSKYKVIARKSGFIVRLLLITLFILFELNFLYLGVILIVEMVVASAFLTAIFLKKEKVFSFDFDKELGKSLIAQSWPLIISSLGAILYLKMDQIMVVSMIDDRTGGIYSVAVKYTSIFYFLHTIIITTIFPKLVVEKKADEANYIANYTRLSSILLYLGIAIIIFTYLFVDLFIKYTFGSAYVDSIPIIKLHILSIPLVYLGALLSKWLILEELTKYSILRHSMGLLVNLALNLILIPVYGAIGAAIGSIGALFFSVIVVLFFNKRLRVLLNIFVKSITYPIFYYGK